jgi:hypothetical protein
VANNNLTKEESKALSVITPEFILSYPHTHTPKQNDDGKEKYSIAAVYTEAATKTANWQALYKAAQLAIKAKWGDKPPKNLRMPFRTDPDDLEDKGYKQIGGVAFMNYSSDNAPGVVDAQLKKIEDEKTIYPGMIARASVRAYAYDTKGNKGVTFGLNNVQILRDGTRLDGRKAPEDEFEALEPAALDDALAGMQ